MVDLDQDQTAQPMATNMFTKKNDLLSSAMKRTSEWIFSQEIPSDVTVNAGGTSFSLHKFPLVSKSGYIRKLVSESTDTDLAVIKIPDIPGGAEAFELAAKFCYGINFEISTENIAMLRCIAEYLEMTEDYAVGNLVGRTEKYVHEVALKSLAGAVAILHSSENLLPLAEKVKLVSRCIDMIAFVACKDSQFGAPGRAESGRNDLISPKSSISNAKSVVDWWAEDLTVLRIDFFQRVLIAMMARGFKQYALGPILTLYAQKSLRGLEIFGKGRKKIEAREEHEKRVVLETIVSLLPREKNAMSAHPALSDMERKKVCSVMDCQKLSREACAHAAQNDRLPVQTVVQVLYHEQQRIREVMDSSLNDSSSLPTKANQFSIDIHPVTDELSTLRKENQDLKLELVKMKMRLKEIAKSDDPKASIGSPSGTHLPFDKLPLPRKSFLSSVSKTLGRFIRADGIVPQSAKRRNKPGKDRRHSIS
ncbi:BTB/POZ domain-containing protein [Abeliophyllum distichum]|uniref:BTB/POZ domain-containing protein n=1 Tax=Abeliophyllum distichum TaxID=126358 RepID=A0ABD1SGK7_9LAMI